MSLEAPNYVTTTFIRKIQLNDNVWSFYFEKPNDFIYKAGQYLNITLPLQNGREETYSFTISSAPYEEHIAITTNKTETPFKKELFDLVSKKEVKIRGPIGGFTFDNTISQTLVFLSGGIGITPFRSIILDFVNNNIQTEIILIASFSTKEDILFYDELKKVENNKIQIVYTITNEIEDGFEKGRISEELIKKYVSHISEVEFGLAGSGEMVDDTVTMLRGTGVENSKIKTDIFTGI